MDLKCADFLTNACLGEKASQTWPIEIVLRATPPLKVHMLSRSLVGNACTHVDLHHCEPLSSGSSSNERVIVGSFLSVCANNIWELMPIQHFWLQIKICCNTLSSLVLVCSSYFPAIRFSSPKSFDSKCVIATDKNT